MSATFNVLDVPEIRARVHPLTVAEFRTLAEDRPGFEHSELIRGVIVEKERKTVTHDKLEFLAADLSSKTRTRPLWFSLRVSFCCT